MIGSQSCKAIITDCKKCQGIIPQEFLYPKGKGTRTEE